MSDTQQTACAICSAYGLITRTDDPNRDGWTEIPHDPDRDGWPAREMWACPDCAEQGGYCATCDEPARERTCRMCGRTMWILDCGHMPQPTPIAAGRADGSDLHHDYCDECA